MRDTLIWRTIMGDQLGLIEAPAAARRQNKSGRFTERAKAKQPSLRQSSICERTHRSARLIQNKARLILNHHLRDPKRQTPYKCSHAAGGQ